MGASDSCTVCGKPSVSKVRQLTEREDGSFVVEGSWIPRCKDHNKMPRKYLNGSPEEKAAAKAKAKAQAKAAKAAAKAEVEAKAAKAKAKAEAEAKAKAEGPPEK